MIPYRGAEKFKGSAALAGTCPVCGVGPGEECWPKVSLHRGYEDCIGAHKARMEGGQ